MSKIKEHLFCLATDRKQGWMAEALKGFLFILSLVYGLIVRSLIFLKRRSPCRLDCVVISVGNLTLGGTGKTTAVYYLAKYLAGQGHRLAVLSRGEASGQNLSDEPRMLQDKLKGIPVIVGTDRVIGARQAIEKYGVDTVILDDGLQQWHIKKDLEIITIDAACPFGNGRLLPRGILRQPLSSLDQADVFVLTKTDLYPDTRATKDKLTKMFPLALVIETIHKPAGFYDLADPQHLLASDALAGESVALFCGIGDPDSFEKLVLGLGVKVGLSLRFGDHHHYTAADLEKISNAARQKNINALITTEKDAAKLQALSCVLQPLRLFVLQVELGFIDDGKDRFYNRLRLLYPL